MASLKESLFSFGLSQHDRSFFSIFPPTDKDFSRFFTCDGFSEVGRRLFFPPRGVVLMLL